MHSGCSKLLVMMSWVFFIKKKVKLLIIAHIQFITLGMGGRDTGNHFDSWHKIKDLIGPWLFIT